MLWRYKYFAEQDFAALNSKLINDAYQRNSVSIIVFDGRKWAFEGGCSDRLYVCIRKRMKKYFPDLKYLYD